MKNRKLFNFLIVTLITLACVSFATCENPIIEKWWVEKEQGPDIEYVPITKMVPQVTYEAVIEHVVEHDVVYKQVFVQLPPEVIYEQLPPQVIHDVVYEQLPPEVIHDVVYEQLPPQVIHDVVYEQLPPQVIYEQLPPEIVYVQLPPEVIYEQLPPEVIYVQLPPEVIYEQLPPQVIHDVVYESIPTDVIYNTIINNNINNVNNVISQEVPTETITPQPSGEELKELLKDKPDVIKEIVKQIPPDQIVEYLTEEQIKEIISKIPPEEIVQYLTEEQIKNVIQYIIDNNLLTDDQLKEIIKNIPSDEIVKYLTDEQINTVIQYIMENNKLTDDQLKKIISKIPPEELITYLTDEQIKYIIQQQPPQVILQTLNIVEIEYIIFAGNADVYNGPPGAGGSTPLTDQEKNSNNASVAAIAQDLVDNPNYLIMLHGHANPTTFNEAEIGDLMTLSIDRANSVETELRTQFKNINGGVDIDNSRVSVSGYGGEKVLFSNNSAYTPLNRRVEMILVWIGVE